MCAHSKALYQANTTHFSKGNRSLLTASTRFTTDLAKFLVCCFVLCRLACVQTRKQRLRVKAAAIWNNVKADICCCCSQWTTYHTVVADNHDFQILHFLKYTSRHLQNKKQNKTSAITGRLWSVFCHYDRQLDYTHTWTAIIQAWVKQKRVALLY